jgi:primosomal replication protein N
VNCVRISATKVATGALRHTPAGLAVSEAGFRYEGSVVEAGSERKLGFEFSAVAVGPVAMSLDREPLGQSLELAGFIAPRSQRTTRLIVHVTEYTKTEGN